MIKFPFFPAVLFLLAPLFSCTGNDLEKSEVSVNGIIIPVEIARTPEERQQGLMERKELTPGNGMLFVFENEEHLSFWMKNTSIPLSIAYISKSGVIKEIHDMTPFSLEPIRSKWSVQYALEVNRGFFSESGIEVGDRVEIDSQYK